MRVDEETMREKKGLVPYSGTKQGAKVVTISGSKGGIGKTFFAVNFAVELKKRGYKVLVFDADINLSNVNLFLNIDEVSAFTDFLEKRVEIRDVIQKGVGGIDAVYAGGDFETILTVGEEELVRIQEGFSQIESEYDYIVVDTQAGLNRLNLGLILSADRNILITNPEITALVDLYKVIKLASGKKRGLSFEIVVNKAVGPQEATRVYQKISQTVAQFGIRTTLFFLGYIVEDSKRVIESIQKRVPIVVLHESGNIQECYRLITNVFLKDVRTKRRRPFFYGLLGR
jgi:flagellar biosynthesis protein FlhG